MFGKQRGYAIIDSIYETLDTIAHMTMFETKGDEGVIAYRDFMFKMFSAEFEAIMKLAEDLDKHEKWGGK